MLFAMLSLVASAQDQATTWTGWISNSSCKAKGMSYSAYRGWNRTPPQEEQNRMFSEDRAPQAEQVIMRADCIALRGEAVKPCESASTQQLGKRRQDSIGACRRLRADDGQTFLNPESGKGRVADDSSRIVGSAAFV